MSRILKVLLFIIGIFIFFEVGLFASYSVISSGNVDPGEIISIQVDEVNDFIGSLTGKKSLNDQETLNITNNDQVALILNNMTNLSVSLNSVTAKVSSDDTGNQTVTITAVATKDAQITNGGAIEIVPEQTYSITATATGDVYSSGKVEIDTSTIQLKERIVLYNQNNTNISTNNSIENLVQYAQNNSTNVTKAANNTTKKTRA
ncbi:hypothetical protein [Methanosphaera cuniculi]|uniref:Uncharacterized protein n=1 Tax=Methanosphaera cuniculi TaxID=1077256 RepID=A0A2A2HF97_9EURY|nr:hypothetical protein [Methanosphaera cuniculi]PAV07954.1 hypothetical protein ASJ82_01565 [Methanosphaera cuniculi]PWL08840.1 hypothetical protein MSCUN_02790 [Methanosphaera cuniculi]